jgi:hypothetical protein
MKKLNERTDAIIGAAMEVHRAETRVASKGPGFG